MTNKLTIAFSRREAELYRSHGLLEEARQLYRQVLEESGGLGSGLAESLQEKIGQLEAELTELDVDLSDVVSERELCILRDGWGDAQSPADVRTCAVALGSIGLYEAAIEEYRKLIRLQQPLADYLEGLTDCLVAIYPSELIKGEIDAIIARDQPPATHPNVLRIAFAMELSRRGMDYPALSLYEAARAVQPLPDRIEAHVKVVQKRLNERPEKDRKPVATSRDQTPAYQLKVRLANRLARLRGLIRGLRHA
jgi:tetratricopeptide (TPR) repeat protein